MTAIESYQSALKGAAYFRQSETGFLRVAGRDRIDFLQRQTTNDLRLLTTDRTVSTVLTSAVARILDLFCVIDQGEYVDLVSLPGRFVETSKFLRGRIFFADQVSVEDLSGAYSQIHLLGPRADDFFEKLSLQPPALDHVVRLEIANLSIMVISSKFFAESGYRLLVPVESMDDILGALDGIGAASLDSETYEILRVEAGRSGPVRELVEAYTPLEVKLGEMISDSKGCYTGQEIIARQITYNKITKSLVGIKLNDLPMVDAEIKVDGKSAGTLTSVVKSPRFGSIGLGVVRRQYSEAGTSISILGGDGSVLSGELVDLPFR